MKTSFDEKKATQIACFFLEKAGGRLPYLSLIKLIYLTDREAIQRWHTPLTRDCYYSLPHGPIVSRTLDLVTDDGQLDPSYWHRFISPPQDYDVTLLDAPERDTLSRAETKLLDEIFAQYGRMDKWQLRDFTHTLPEYTDPHGGRNSITYDAILQACGFAETQAEEIAEQINDENGVRCLFAC